MARIHFLQDTPVPVTAQRYRMHPLTAAAAVSVITVSLVGVGVMTGVVPQLRSAHAGASRTAANTVVTRAVVVPSTTVAERTTAPAVAPIVAAPPSTPSLAPSPSDTKMVATPPAAAKPASTPAAATAVLVAAVTPSTPALPAAGAAMNPSAKSAVNPTLTAAAKPAVKPVAPAEALAPGETLVSAEALRPSTPASVKASTASGLALQSTQAVPVATPKPPSHAAASRVRPAAVVVANNGPTHSLFSGGRSNGTSSAGAGAGNGPRAIATTAETVPEYPAPRERVAGRVSPSEPSVVSAPSPVTVSPVTAQTAPAPKITPVIRAPIPLDAPANTVATIDPAARSGASARTYQVERAPGERYETERYATERNGGDRYASDRYQRERSQAGNGMPAQPGVGQRIGTVFGGTVGEGIDRTIAVLANVLGANRPIAPPVQDFPLDPSRYQVRDNQRDFQRNNQRDSQHDLQRNPQAYQPYANGAYER